MSSLPPPIPPVEGVVAGAGSVRPGIMFDTDSPKPLAVSRTCSTTRLITLRDGARLALLLALRFAAAFLTGAERFAGAGRRGAVRFFEAVLRLAAPFFEAGRRLAALFFDELFFAVLFFAEVRPRFAAPRRAVLFFAGDFEDRAELRDDFFELFREEDLFLVAIRLFSLGRTEMMAVTLLDRLFRKCSLTC